MSEEKDKTETKKVNIELEVDTNVVDSSKNKYQNQHHNSI